MSLALDRALGRDAARLLDTARHGEFSPADEEARLRLPRSRQHARENSACCWDLDSTLAGTRHRFHVIEQIKAGQATWDDHSMACADDEPLTASIALMRLLAPYHAQHIISGRSAVAEKLTHGWLARHDVPADHVELRDPDDFTENGLIKARYVQKLQAQGITVAMFFEDWAPAAELIHELTGVPVAVLTPPYRGETHSRIDNYGLDGIPRGITGCTECSLSGSGWCSTHVPLIVTPGHK